MKPTAPFRWRGTGSRLHPGRRRHPGSRSRRSCAGACARLSSRGWFPTSAWRVPEWGCRLGRRRGVDGGGRRPGRQDLHHRLRGTEVRRTPTRPSDREPLRHGALRVRGEAGRGRSAAAPGPALQRTVRGLLGDSHLLCVEAHPPACDRSAQRGRWRRELRRVRELPASPALGERRPGAEAGPEGGRRRRTRCRQPVGDRQQGGEGRARRYACSSRAFANATCCR